MKKEFQIMNIKGVDDTRYGSIVLVEANPVETNSLGMRFVTQHICSSTESFFFPDDDDIIQPLVSIARGGGLWTPNMADFSAENIHNADSNRIIKVYRHKSFWSDDYDMSLNSGARPELIANKHYKANQLKEQYYRNGWYESMSLYDYVFSLAVGDDVEDFFSWLFDDPSLAGFSLASLSLAQTESFDDFMDLFDEEEF